MSAREHALSPVNGSPFEVFRVFLKMGVTSFGGPIAHLGYFRDELVVRRKWIDEDGYGDLVALCQFLPGPASSQVGFSLGVLRGNGLLGGLAAWRPSVIEHGPAFGAFVDGRLAAMASTHFATTDVIEIGNIVTHPAHRRRGLAAACTSALVESCFNLASRVYLMVLAENDAAFALYRGLGFWPSERFAFARFRLAGAAATP